MKLIYLPLAFLIIMSLMSMLGLGSTSAYNTSGSTGVDQTFIAPSTGWYDATGHQVADRQENTVGIGEAGGIHVSSSHYYWMNSTNVGANGWESTTAIQAAGAHVYDYPIYDVLENQSLASRASRSNTISFDTASSFGLIALVVGLMALAAIAGLQVFGSGISEESVSTIIKGTAFLSLWAIFSITAMPLIVAIPMFGVIFYFCLSGVYTLGVVNQFGHPGED